MKDGTEKQIKWAEDIKAKINNLFKPLIENPKCPQKAIEAVERLNKIDNAQFWIEVFKDVTTVQSATARLDILAKGEDIWGYTI